MSTTIQTVQLTCLFHANLAGMEIIKLSAHKTDSLHSLTAAGHTVSTIVDDNLIL